jgi:hypothetical protein
MRPEISATLQADLAAVVGAILGVLILGWVATRMLRAWRAIRGQRPCG